MFFIHRDISDTKPILIDSTISDKITKITVTRNKESNGYSYVKPYVTHTGKYVKGHVRRNISTDVNAYKKRLYSRNYYQTHKELIKMNRKSKK